MFDLHFVKGGVAKFGKEDSPQVNTISATASSLPLEAKRAGLFDKVIAAWNSQKPEIPLVQTGLTYASAKYVCEMDTSPYQLVLPSSLKKC